MKKRRYKKYPADCQSEADHCYLGLGLFGGGSIRMAPIVKVIPRIPLYITFLICTLFATGCNTMQKNAQLDVIGYSCERIEVRYSKDSNDKSVNPRGIK